MVSGPGPILPRTFPGGQRRHVHALHGRGPFSPGRGRAIMHLLTVPVGIVTCGRHACVSLLKLGGGSGQSGLTSGWTSPSMRPQSSSVVPASGPVLVPVEALLLACVVLKVGSGSGPAGAPPSEPARQRVSVCVCVCQPGAAARHALTCRLAVPGSLQLRICLQEASSLQRPPPHLCARLPCGPPAPLPGTLVRASSPPLACCESLAPPHSPGGRAGSAGCPPSKALSPAPAPQDPACRGGPCGGWMVAPDGLLARGESVVKACRLDDL